ncbi:MAG: class I SAM-dependent methyltransferase [Myxococcota bacterium]
MAKLDNRSYYDEFSTWYERERHQGYHALIDDLQTDLVMPACNNADVLEVGCGTGLILRRVAPVARSAIGIDLSAGMLHRAVARGLDVVQADVTALPFADASFDTVYSFKVLSHVRDLELALAECARVTRPGGRLFLEFYNRRSLRYLVKRLAWPGAVSPNHRESDVYTRWYTLTELLGLLPQDLNLLGTAGVRVITPVAAVHQLPIVRTFIRQAEYMARDSRRLSHYGGFLVLVLQRRDA